MPSSQTPKEDSGGVDLMMTCGSGGRGDVPTVREEQYLLWQTFKGVLGESSTADSDAHTADDFAATKIN